MQSAEQWKPTKYEIHKGGLRGSRNPRYLNVAERIYVDYEAAAMTQFIPRYCHGKLADIGCGEVPFYAFYQPYVDNVITVDWENSIHPNPFVEIHANLNEPPIVGIESESLDCVLCSDVLEHIYHPQRLVAEISRILKKDGKLLLTVPLLFWVHEEPYDFYRYTLFFLERILEENQMRILERVNHGGAPEVIAMFASISALYGLGKLGKPLAYSFSQFPRWLYLLPGIRKKVMETSDLLTLGYTLVAVKEENCSR